MMASGGLEAVASGVIANAAHHFFGINPETGRIIGAIAGNIIFNLGGKDNSLSGIGKMVLDNIISGKYKRKVRAFFLGYYCCRNFANKLKSFNFYLFFVTYT